jgi:hypothetical protein
MPEVCELENGDDLQEVVPVSFFLHLLGVCFIK